MTATHQNRKDFDPPIATKFVSSLHAVERGANLFPIYLEQVTLLGTGEEDRELVPNLSTKAKTYLKELDGAPEDLFHHALAVMHSSAYRTENAGGLRQDWPRIPLPGTLEALRVSATLGRQLVALLDPTVSVQGVTTGTIRPELRPISVISRVGGGQLGERDLEVTARWGNYANGKTQPGPGNMIMRAFSADEAALEDLNLGLKAVDVYLNKIAYWRCIPERVWEYTLGGYQVIKKWLSYREFSILERSLTPDEVKEVTGIARRIAAILLLESKLNDNYRSSNRLLGS